MRSVYLYLFERGVTTIRKAASRGDVLAGGNTWTATQISHSEPEMTGEAARDSVKVNLPLTDSFANQQVKNRPDGAVTVTIYIYNRDTGTSEVEWSGRIAHVSVSGSDVTLNCEPDSSALAGSMLPLIAMRQCPHTQYTGKCRLAAGDFRYSATLLSVAGPVVTVAHSSALAGLLLPGGVIEASDGSSRMIKSYSAGVIVMTRSLPRLSVDIASTSPTVNLIPSCGNVPSGCAAFANPANPSGTNIENYGGHQWMLTGEVNPFGGSSVI